MADLSRGSYISHQIPQSAAFADAGKCRRSRVPVKDCIPRQRQHYSRDPPNSGACLFGKLYVTVPARLKSMRQTARRIPTIYLNNLYNTCIRGLVFFESLGWSSTYASSVQHQVQATNKIFLNVTAPQGKGRVVDSYFSLRIHLSSSQENLHPQGHASQPRTDLLTVVVINASQLTHRATHECSGARICSQSKYRNKEAALANQLSEGMRV